MIRLLLWFSMILGSFVSRAELKPIFQYKAYVAPKYQDGSRLSYVAPQAKKGGTLSFSTAKLDFNTFNPHVFMGWPAEKSELLHARLMFQPLDDPTNLYAYAAEGYEQGPDFIRFKLRRGLTFSDGSPITAQDVAESFKLLKHQGKKAIQALYASIEVQVVAEQDVIFKTNALTQDQAFHLAQLPVLKKQETGARKGLAAPACSGPYRVKDFNTTHHVTYERRRDWWGATLWMNQGQYNLDELTVFYIPSPETAFQAFKKKLYTVRRELNVQWWQHRYGFAEKETGLRRFDVSVPHPQTLAGIFFNTQNPLFKTQAVRVALQDLFDFDTLNQGAYFGHFKRVPSVFWSDLWQARFKEKSPEVHAKLQAARPGYKSRSFGSKITPTEALAVLKEAGWEKQGSKLVHKETGTPAKILIVAQVPYHKTVLSGWTQILRSLGIEVQVRMTTPGEYFKRLNTHAYDVMVINGLPFYDVVEGMRSIWGAPGAGRHALSQVQEDAVMKPLVEALGHVTTEEEEQTLLGALDAWTYAQGYFMPLWFRSVFHMAAWTPYHIPTSPIGQTLYENWYVLDADMKEAAA